MCLNSQPQAALFIVSTPLGNLGDLSPRAASTLALVDVILAEDTRRTGTLLKMCDITAKKMVSFHEHNEAARISFALEMLKEGKSLAVVSDAGTPLISDPGFKLVKAVREEGFAVSVVPGPSAVLAALAGSGIAPYPFSFLGFLPRKEGDKSKLFANFAKLECTIVFFERKDRVEETLQTAYTQLGRREYCIARELTKQHEEFVFGYLGSGGNSEEEGEDPLSNFLGLLGEITVVIGPQLEEVRTPYEEAVSIFKQLAAAESGLRPKELARSLCAKLKGWSLKEAYELTQQYR